MLTAFYIIVALLQFSIGQESVQYESKISKEATAIPDEYTDEDFIRYIGHTEEVKDNNDFKTNDVSIAEENIVEPIELINVVYADPVEQEEITTLTSYNTDAETTSVAGPNEQTEANEIHNVDEDVSNNIITVSDPVKAGDKVTVTNFECEDNNDFTSNEEVSKISEPITFGGCAKTQGKVTIAAHFGCGENTGNVVTLPEKDEKVTKEMSDDSISFGGPVHAGGKVIVGSHYGCGAPIGMYQSPVFLPWFPPFFHPQIYYPPHPIPVFTAQYPYPFLDTKPFTVFQGLANEPGNEDAPDLPVASSVANLETDKHNGVPFSGVVPAAGTVSIAARF